MWVIPFDNHPSSTNALCSVGITLDAAASPPRGADPEAELREMVGRFPSVARQFRGARAVRAWTTTGRLQFSSTRLSGDRFCLLPHAGAFVDPLFSSGLAVTMNAVNAMAWRILAALRDGDFSGERFAYVDTWVKRSFAYYDTLVSSSYKAFRDYEVWNAWHRVWMIGSLYGVTGLFEALSRFESTGDHKAFDLCEQPPYRGVQAIDLPGFQQLLDDAARQVDAFHAGEQSAGRTTAAIYDLIRASELAPGPWPLLDPEDRCPAGTYTVGPLLRLVAWGRYRSPEVIRRHYFMSGRTNGLLGELLGSSLGEMGRATRAAGGILRDALVSWNEDWRADQGQGERARSAAAAAAGASPPSQTSSIGS